VKVRAAFALVSVLFAAGCADVQKPYQFTAPHPPNDAVDNVARTLAANGHQPQNIDRQTGIVTTKWEDTGFGYGFVQNVKANIVRRFTVTIAKGSTGTGVTVRMDGKRCQEGGYTIGDVDVRGACETMDEIVPSHQKDLDSLGMQIQQGLSTGG
jgi:hypothetical protein